MSENKIEFLASIKKVVVKNLVSGDKETRIELSIVGPSTVEANKLSDLKPEEMVKVIYNPEI